MTDEIVNNAWINDIDLEELERLAGIGFTPEKIAMYFKINQDDFIREYLATDSILKFHFDRGILLCQAQEGLTAMASAAKGNITHAQRLDKIRSSIEFEEKKKEIIYGD